MYKMSHMYKNIEYVKIKNVYTELFHWQRYQWYYYKFFVKSDLIIKKAIEFNSSSVVIDFKQDVTLFKTKRDLSAVKLDI